MARQSGQSSCLLGKVVESEKKEKLDLIVATSLEFQVVAVDRLGSAQRDQQQLFSS